MFHKVWTFICTVALAINLCASNQLAFAGERRTAAILNNEGVMAIQNRDFATAIKKLEASLALDPNYEYPIANLAIAYNNFGLQQPPSEGINWFHKSLYIDSGNRATVLNLNACLRALKADPRSYETRVKYGTEELGRKDYVGAIVEFEQALQLKDDPALAAKLSALPHPAISAIHSDVASVATLRQASSGAPNAYVKVVESKIKEHWKTTHDAQAHIIVTTFDIDRAGRLSDLKLKTSSGVPAMDDAALKAVRMAAPFPPPSKNLPSKVSFLFKFDDLPSGSNTETEQDKFEFAAMEQTNHKRYEEAIPTWENALAAAEKIGDNGSTAYYCLQLGKCFEALGKLSDAEAYYKRAIELEQKFPRHTDGSLLAHQQAYAKLLYKTGKTAESDEIYKQLRGRSIPPGP